MDGSFAIFDPQRTNGNFGGEGWRNIVSIMVDPCRMALVEVGDQSGLLDSHQNMGTWWERIFQSDG